MSGPVRSVSQAFAILRLLSAHPGGLTLSAIGRELALSPSSCLNLLRTLLAEGMIERPDGTKLYRACATWDRLDFARGAVERLTVRARPLMEQFARAHDCTTGLWHAVSADRLALVALEESGSETAIRMAIGQRQPIGGGATGRALAASEEVGDDELRRRFAPLRSLRPLDFETYAREVADARLRGFAVDRGYGHPGVWSIGCRIGGTGTARFCLSASVFADSIGDDAFAELGRALIQCAQDIARSAA